MNDAGEKMDLVRRLERLTVKQRRRLMEIGSAYIDSGRARPGSATDLVAVVSMTESQGPSVDLLAYLKESLPQYMVPSRIILVGDLPKLPNGKVDRARLELLVEEESGAGLLAEPAGTSFEPPSTRIEETLAEVWSEVLGSDRISRNDHFFEMGGDSILSIQVVSRGRMADLPIEATDLFEYPVLSELARVLEQRTSHPAPRTSHPAPRTSHPAPRTPPPYPDPTLVFQYDPDRSSPLESGHLCRG